MTAILSAALTYATRGWRVLPVNGKIPLLKDWPTLATTDPDTIRSWWAQWATANVGIATGKETGLFVLDVDPAKGGDDSLRKLEVQYGALPDTIEVLTGGGGRQYYFQHPGCDIRNSAGKLGSGLDIRTAGGQVVAPPSVHPATRRTYEWEGTHHPDDIPPAPIPHWLLSLLTAKPDATSARTSQTFPQGQRNDCLAREAGRLRRMGLSETELEAALLAINRGRCMPPLSYNEVHGIAASVARYPAGEQNEARQAPLTTPSADTAHLHTPPTLAQNPNILAAFEQAVRLCGVVGEERCAKVLFLALTSRVLMEPVSLAIKGLSSSGKSYTTETTLRFFPKTAYIAMTAMSERALVYMKEDFAHKTLVIFEAVALREQREKNESNLTAYFLRSLLSEGRISYPVTVRDKHEGFVTKTIIKEGPTNVILTTTATELHGENETRLLSLPTNDSREQTKAVMLRLAEGKPREVNVQDWHALQNWLTTAEHRVTIPFAGYLAESIPPVAVRLRRDFKALLRLIETHALLHQCSRERDDEGRIMASDTDYMAVRELVADLVASGVGATVPETMRATVQAVQHLALVADEGVTVRQVAHELKLDRSATQRRVQAARERGYLVNLEEKRGRPARYAIGEPLPEEMELLPAELGCAHSTLGTHSSEESVSPSDAEPFEGGVHLCSISGEKYTDEAAEVIDLAN